MTTDGWSQYRSKYGSLIEECTAAGGKTGTAKLDCGMNTPPEGAEAYVLCCTGCPNEGDTCSNCAPGQNATIVATTSNTANIVIKGKGKVTIEFETDLPIPEGLTELACEGNQQAKNIAPTVFTSQVKVVQDNNTQCKEYMNIWPYGVPSFNRKTGHWNDTRYLESTFIGTCINQ